MLDLSIINKRKECKTGTTDLVRRKDRNILVDLTQLKHLERTTEAVDSEEVAVAIVEAVVGVTVANRVVEDTTNLKQCCLQTANTP